MLKARQIFCSLCAIYFEYTITCHYKVHIRFWTKNQKNHNLMPRSTIRITNQLHISYREDFWPSAEGGVGEKGKSIRKSSTFQKHFTVE